MQVKDIMTQNVIACTPDTSVRDVAKILVENGFSGMPVVETDKVVGVVSQDELLKIEQPIHIPKFLGILGAAVYLDNPLDGDEVEKQIHQVLATRVSEIMVRDFEVIEEDLDFHEAADLMIKKNLSLLPVVDNNETLVGIITKSDIVAQLAQE